jgi:hypothetical protein
MTEREVADGTELLRTLVAERRCAERSEYCSNPLDRITGVNLVLTDAELDELDAKANRVPNQILHTTAWTIIDLAERDEDVTDRVVDLARTEAKMPGALDAKLDGLSDGQRETLKVLALGQATAKQGDVDAKALCILAVALNVSTLRERCTTILRTLPTAEYGGIKYESTFVIAVDNTHATATAKVTPKSMGRPDKADEDAAYEALLHAAKANGLVMTDPGVFVLPPS